MDAARLLNGCGLPPSGWEWCSLVCSNTVSNDQCCIGGGILYQLVNPMKQTQAIRYFCFRLTFITARPKTPQRPSLPPPTPQHTRPLSCPVSILEQRTAPPFTSVLRVRVVAQQRAEELKRDSSARQQAAASAPAPKAPKNFAQEGVGKSSSPGFAVRRLNPKPTQKPENMVQAFAGRGSNRLECAEHRYNCCCTSHGYFASLQCRSRRRACRPMRPSFACPPSSRVYSAGRHFGS